jgi:hypothetical protein
MTEKAQSEKRQQQPRPSSNMTARIMAPGQLSPAPCVILEISPAGAKLELAKGWIIPRSFWLRIDGDPLMHRCAIKWVEGDTFGVEFPSDCAHLWWNYIRAIGKQLPNRNRL